MSTKVFQNPLLNPGPDPWIYHHTDGMYYLMVTKRNKLVLQRNTALSKVAQGEEKTIWLPSETDYFKANFWAPELHYIENKWYVYFTANDGGGDDTRRVLVIENSNEDPYVGDWELKGVINTERPGLDGSVFYHKEQLYFLYAGYGHFPDYGSAIYIAAMENPWTLKGEEVLLTKPEYDWEKQGGMAINEGPVILKRNGKLFLVYSASTTWSDDYSLGMLTINEDDDVLDVNAWSKSPKPVFSKNVEQGVYGPGHNSFTTSPDRTEDWIVYHAFTNGGENNPERSLRIQAFSWNEDGTPNFGRPIGLANDIPVPSGE